MHTTSTSAPHRKQRRTAVAKAAFTAFGLGVAAIAFTGLPSAQALAPTLTVTPGATAVDVGDVPGNLSVRIDNTGAIADLTSVAVNPGCDDLAIIQTTAPSPCPTGAGQTPIFDLGTPVSDPASTSPSCVAATWTLGAPDGEGNRAVIPNAAVSINNLKYCKINFPNAQVTGIPAVGSSVAFAATLTDNMAVAASSASDTGLYTISQATPNITSQAAPSNAATGELIRDLATVSGEIPDGTANLLFELYGPYETQADVDCAPFDRVFTSSSVVNAPGNVLSPTTSVGQPGIYQWIAYFSGDDNNTPAQESCGNTDQQVTITGPVIVIPDPDDDGPPAPGTCNGLAATIVGGSGSQNLTGTAGDDVVVLGSGNDTYNGTGGNDIVCGGSGNDVINTPGATNNFIDGGSGNDSIDSGAGTDTINGGSGNDSMNHDTPDDDTVDGGSGNNSDN